MSAGNCIAIANESRESIPLEKRFTGVSMCRSSSANALTASMRETTAWRGIPSDTANSATFSRPVSSGWKPIPTAKSGITRPRMRMTPLVGRIVPAMT